MLLQGLSEWTTLILAYKYFSIYSVWCCEPFLIILWFDECCENILIINWHEHRRWSWWSFRQLTGRDISWLHVGFLGYTHATNPHNVTCSFAYTCTELLIWSKIVLSRQFVVESCGYYPHVKTQKWLCTPTTQTQCPLVRNILAVLVTYVRVSNISAITDPDTMLLKLSRWVPGNI